MKGCLTVIGCGTCFQDLTTEYLQIISKTEVLAGGQRLLDWFPDFQGETIELGTQIKETVAKLFEIAKSKRVVALASGDPLFFGIGSLLIDAPEDIAVTILPNVTAAQTAMTRLGLPWAGTRFFSIHGRYFSPTLAADTDSGHGRGLCRSQTSSGHHSSRVS